MSEIICILLAGISGYFISTYLHFKFLYLVAFGLLIGILFCIRVNRNSIVKKISVNVLLAVFSLALSLVIILGDHIHVENSYSGLMTENYILSYSIKDFFGVIFIAFGIYEIVKCLYVLCLENTQLRKIQFCFEERISYRKITIVAFLLFFVWLPYLFVYYPGYVFGDTMSSITQALDWAPLNNHHPIFYTLFIKLCLKIGNIFGGNTEGCMVYCIFQMVFMSVGLAYLICWLSTRMKLKGRYIIILTMFYGCVPYFAQMSIAMWKDPIFAVTLVIVTLKIADFVFSKGEVLNLSFIIEYFILLLILIFIRNNGIYIAFFMGVSLFVMFMIQKRDFFRIALLKLLILTMSVVVIAKIITGPIYDRVGIEKEQVESYGIFLNQMARVVAYDGEMSVGDKEYMNKLLPLELYKTTYYPCCVDMLKWNSEFDATGLNQDFFKRYFSMLIKNPRCFFEAWELQTYGFWTVNCEEINYYPGNIMGGVPRNYYPEYYEQELESYDIHPGKYVNHEVLTSVFPIEDAAIPIGIINWSILLLIIFIILQRKEILLLVLTPSVGLIITLIVASPISYWPRYAAAEQYLIPFYLMLFLMLRNQK